jgi:plastocyanin
MTMATRSIRRLVIGGALGGALALIGSGLGSVALAADHAVDIAGFAFSPQTITIAVGDTVTWTNADVQGHTATADDDSFDTGTIGGNASKSATFSAAGTVAYHCKIHPQMTATIVVQAAGGSAPPTDTVPPIEPVVSGTSPATWAFLSLVAITGLILARRRFDRAEVPAIIDPDALRR